MENKVSFQYFDVKSWFQKLKPKLICCGIPKHWAVQIISLIDVALSVGWVIYLVYGYFSHDSHDKLVPPGLQACWMSYFATSSVRIALSCILFTSAITRNSKKCRIWLLVTIIMFLNKIVVISFHIAIFHGHKERRYSVPIALTLLTYRAYTIFIVSAFMRSVVVSKLENSVVALTPEEVISFFNGEPRTATVADSSLGLIGRSFEHEPYDKSYEVNRDFLVLEEECPLEQTDNDILLQGTVYYTSGAFSPVTVKTVAKHASTGYFKSVLSELKIMTMVSTMGKHQNVLTILGAVTSPISTEREVFILLEFISFGNLHQYLKVNKRRFLNFVEEGVICHSKEYCNVNPAIEKDFVTTYNLLHWCAQISNGLDFLSSIGIVHGDIRTKNVYLCEGKVAKLMCSALPRQLHFYSTYEKKSEEIPLPWRHMAIESLRDMHFTTESDVWSLGTTYWEIFRLGSIPFPGIAWSTGFVNYLSRGLRMKKPAFAPDFVYKLMLQCWDIDSSARPTSQQLCLDFERALQDATKRRHSGAGQMSNKVETVGYENV